MYVCMHACMHACTYVYISVRSTDDFNPRPPCFPRVLADSEPWSRCFPCWHSTGGVSPGAGRIHDGQIAVPNGHNTRCPMPPMYWNFVFRSVTNQCSLLLLTLAFHSVHCSTLMFATFTRTYNNFTRLIAEDRRTCSISDVASRCE